MAKDTEEAHSQCSEGERRKCPLLASVYVMLPRWLLAKKYLHSGGAGGVV